MKQYILALDQGTSSSRAIVFDEKGSACAVAQREFRQIFPKSGWVEHDPHEIWSSQASVIAEAITMLDINGLKNFNKEFGRDYGDEVVTRVGEVLEEYFRSSSVYRLTGDEYLVIVENCTYDEFAKQVHAVHEKFDNISLGLVSIGYAWEKLDIDISNLVSSAENMMRDEKKKYYKNLRKGHHEPIIKQDVLDDIENGNFIV